MNAIWQKLFTFWNTHKLKSIAIILGIVFAFGLFAIVSPVFAVDSLGEIVSDPYGAMMSMFAWAVEGLAQWSTKLLILLINILIGIINYDAFNSSQVIEIGWPIVRDAINMFVILALLAIAIKNLMPGQSDNARAQKQLTNVLIAVVLMNFSRTIALLAVDLSQVVTITFAQAVSDIASGNFIQLFSLQNNLVVSATTTSITSGAEQSMILFASAAFKLLLLGCAIVAMVAIVIAFLIRILLIWFLIVVAPAAFFAFGIKDAFSKAGQIWSQWVDQFTGLLLFGPVLMFFLWLSLAITSGGSIAGTQGFSEFQPMDGAFLIESAQPASVLTTMIGIIMLMIGITTAAKMAGSTAGIGKVLSKAQGAATTFLTKGAKYAGYGAAAAATGGMAFSGMAGAAGVGLVVGTAAGLRSNTAIKGYKAVTEFGTKAGGALERTVGVVPGLGIASRGLRNLASKGTSGLDSISASRQKVARAKFDALDDVAKQEILRTSLSGNLITNKIGGKIGGKFGDAIKGFDKFSSPLEVNAVKDQAFISAVTDEELRKGIKSSDPKLFSTLIKQIVNTSDDDMKSKFSFIEDAKDRTAKLEKAKQVQIQNLSQAESPRQDELIDDIVKDPKLFSQLRKDGLNSSVVKKIADRSFTTTYFDNKTQKMETTTMSGDVMAMKNAREDVKSEFGKIQKNITLGVTDAQKEEARGINWTTITENELKDKINTNAISPIDVQMGAGTVLSPAIITAIADKIDATNIESIPQNIAKAMGDEFSQKAASFGADSIKSLSSTVRKQVEDYITKTLNRSSAAPADVAMRKLLFDGKEGTLGRAFDYTGQKFTQASGKAAFQDEFRANPEIIFNMPVHEPEMHAAVIAELGQPPGVLINNFRTVVHEAVTQGDKAKEKMKATVAVAIDTIDDQLIKNPSDANLIEVRRRLNQFITRLS